MPLLLLGRPQAVAMAHAFTSQRTGAGTMQSSVSGGGAHTAPLGAAIDVARFGGALVLTSACEFGQNDWGELPETIMLGEVSHDDVSRDCGQFERSVPGNVYRLESAPQYREQSLLGAELITCYLEDIGVPPELIQRVDYCGRDAPDEDPAARVRRFFRSLYPQRPEALIYFCGPSGPRGEWAFDWLDGETQPHSYLLHPSCLPVAPGTPADGPVGVRFVVADAPYTADLWSPTEPQLMGYAAWVDGGMPGGNGGPPLARWLTGRVPGPPPQGTVVFDKPSDVHLRELPAYEPLFWAPAPLSEERVADLLWEVQAFIGASTRRDYHQLSNFEVMGRGGLRVLLAIVLLHGATAKEDTILQCLWLMHSLAAYSQPERWMRMMAQSMRAALQLANRRQHVSKEFVSACFEFVACCLGRCARARAAVSQGTALRKAARALALQHLDTEASPPSEDMKSSLTFGPQIGGTGQEKAIVSACRMVAQLCNHEPPDMRDHLDRALVEALIKVLVKTWDPRADAEVKCAAAEALKCASLRSQDVKKRIVTLVELTPKFLPTLEAAGALAAAQLLACLRSLAALAPDGEADAGPSAVAAAPPPLPPNTPTAAISCLARLADDKEVQRWGFSLLGALAARNFSWPSDEVATSAADRVIWVLGTEALDHSPAVEREALFATYYLMMHPSSAARARLMQPAADLIALVAAATARSAAVGDTAAAKATAAGPGESALADIHIEMDVIAWGIKVIGLIAVGAGGAKTVAPHTTAVVSALLAPYCTEGTSIACAETLCMCMAGDNRVKAHLTPDRGRIIRCLQERARDLPQANRELMTKWVRVLIEALGDYEPPGCNEDVNRSAAQEAEDALFPFEREKMAEKASRVR